MRHSSPSESRALRPPLGFRAASGVREAWRTSSPFPRTPAGKTAAQKFGIRYEKRVHEFLHAALPGLYDASPWFKYRNGKGELRYCSPDGIFRLGNVAIIFEVKSRFTSDAWYQLRRVYEPVVRAAYGPTRLGLCVIAKSYDPSTIFPEPYDLLDALEPWIIHRQFDTIGVFPWKP